MKKLHKILFMTLLFFTQTALSFPLYYKCGAGDRLEDSFAGPEILQSIESLISGELSSDEFDQRAQVYCQGSQQCISELGQIKSMLDDSVDILAEIEKVKERYSQEIARAEVDDSRFNTIKSIVDSAFTVHACHEVKKTWSGEAWTGNDGDNFAVFYPRYNNYMYASGCLGKGRNAECPGNKISNYKEQIKSALLMGMDPYLAIALAWLEGGTTEGLGYLYLDPVAKFSAMGCTGSSISGASATDQTLDSYGTFYNIRAEVHTNPNLSLKIASFQKAKSGQAPAQGESYFCRLVNDDLGLVYDQPQVDSCCLKLPYAAGTVKPELIEEAFVYEQARKIYQTRFRSNEDPAFRIQRFNGYTTLMGAAEGVEAFRSGVNYYENPAYGYQAMDFIVNSILPNPIFRKLVADAEAEVKQSLGREANWRSIMCVEHPGGGNFAVDSDHYFKLHRDTPRLGPLEAKWKAGQRLSDREYRIMENEVVTLVERGIMPVEAMDIPVAEQTELFFRGGHYDSRNTIGKASVNQSTYTWESFSPNELRNIGANTLGR